MSEPEVYNTKVTVVENISALSPADAVRTLAHRLERAGFNTITDAGDDYSQAFLAEPGTEVTKPSPGLPPGYRHH